ncbi:hypothetical protein [Acinetobacter ursingii]|uniref:hypothetical protein n=1 Tax=Acinetobacter ursingii TaxID=108980 RepID=UPI0012500053|nr:hypothetical protein [Acinetobacter ursingii]MEC8056996.1 hypothetical protein [Pseudomonadota bacterium]
MIDLATKQAFWCEQLPNFEAKYWLPSHFEFLIFDKDQGNYVIKEDLDPSFEDEATEIFHRVNTGWAMWKKAINFNDQQAEIDSLKAENEELKTAYSGTNAALLAQLKINSDLHEKLLGVSDGEYVVIKKDDIENWYLDEGEYVWYEKDSIDGYLEDLDNGEVLEVQRKEYVVINSNPVFATNVYEDADNINWELFDSKEEAEKAATHCKAMVEAQGDGDE